MKYIIIPVSDLEAVRDKLDEYEKSDLGQIVAIDKILTHYKKVDLSDKNVEKMAKRALQPDNPFESMDDWYLNQVEGYQRAIKDITGK